MIICGIKTTHDGGIAIIENGMLKYSVEMEKIDNKGRYSDFSDLNLLPKLLRECGYEINQIDQFVIDGWHGTGRYWNGESKLILKDGSHENSIRVAPYSEKRRLEDILQRFTFGDRLLIEGKIYNYSSYMHVTGHVMSAYCTSPFAQRNESSYVLVWDGGLYPRLYYYDINTNTIKNIGHLFLFLGTIYSIIAQYFGPYKKTKEQLFQERAKRDIEGYFGGYSVAGKIMSYIALGNLKPELFELFNQLRAEQTEVSNELEHLFSKKLRQLIHSDEYSDVDVLATFHAYLEGLLLDKLEQKTKRYPEFSKNLCFVGGCALNIKWNSSIRDSKLFNDVYVPPFPNDSGSAIGVAAAENLRITRRPYIDWNVYSGPNIVKGAPNLDWQAIPCSIEALAMHLYKSDEPTIFLDGRAELGPRALGNRSILASPINNVMKDLLNKVKQREYFRPVAPICLESEATKVFIPGCQDPYMLFDHQVREEWKKKIPAICHIDGSARLQTVNETSNPTIFALLKAFYDLTSIPLLCNTSANYNGSGFFPDLASAMKWGRLNYIWYDNQLYTRKDKLNFKSILDQATHMD